MEKISYYKKYLILVFCLLLLAASTIAFFKLNNEKTEVEDNFVANNEIITKEVNEVAKQEEVKLYFDIKGSVKNQVYMSLLKAIELSTLLIKLVV